MADVFDSLLGGGTDDQSAIIAQLRRQNMLGQMAQLSGDRVLSPLGRQQMSSAQDTAMQLGNQNARRQLRTDEQAFRTQQTQQSQQNADRAYQLQLAQAALNEQFRRDNLAQTTADREAQRAVSLANAKEAADARRAASTQSTEKVARELRGELNKANSMSSLVEEAYTILQGDDAPGTSLPTRALRSTAEALGYATSGTKSLRKLSSIGSLLVQAAPKLGGAMSDSDVKLYQDAAGALADPGIPNDAKMAALETMFGVIERNKEHLNTELGSLTGQQPRGAKGGSAAQTEDWMKGFTVLPSDSPATQSPGTGRW